MIAIHIARSKANWVITFGQLIEYNMRNIFLQKLYIKHGGGTSPRPFFKKPKLSMSLDQQSEFLCSLFLVYVQVKD